MTTLGSLLEREEKETLRRFVSMTALPGTKVSNPVKVQGLTIIGEKDFQKLINSYTPANFLVCRDCDSTFYLSDKERGWFERKNLVAPRRCSPCRKTRRNV